jgi:uncharacterized protein (DUF885 family)
MRRCFVILLVWLLVACQGPAIAEPTPSNAPTQAAPERTAEAPPLAGDASESPTAPAVQSIDAFFQTSYQELLLRDPELVTQAGLSDLFGVRNDQLTDLSAAYLRETQALERQILDQLRSYDRDALTPDHQLSYDIYDWYLADLVAGHAFADYDYPVNHIVTSVHHDTIQLFTDIHPIRDRQDVEDYVSRLSQVKRKFDQLIAGLRSREEAGIVLPRFAIEWTLPSVRQIANNVPRNTPLYTSLDMRMKVLSSIDPPTQADLLAQAEREIERSVIPAFQALADVLTDQLTVATDDDGVWKFPNGAAYYEYVLRHFSTTDMTAAEIHALGLMEVDRIQAEMQVLFAELGYPADDSLPQLMNRVVAESGVLIGDDIVASYEALIKAAQRDVRPAFDREPQADVIVIGVPRGGYYVRPAADGSRPGAFYATAQGEDPRYGMATLAYHEAVP